LLDAELLDRAQHEDAPERGRQRVDRVLDRPADLAARERLLRARLASRGRRGVERLVAHVLDIDGGPALALAHHGLVENDAGEPGRDAGLALEALDVGEGAHIARLYRLFRFRIVSQYAPRQTIKPLVVAAHEIGVGRGPPGPQPRDQ